MENVKDQITLALWNSVEGPAANKGPIETWSQFGGRVWYQVVRLIRERSQILVLLNLKKELHGK